MTKSKLSKADTSLQVLIIIEWVIWTHFDFDNEATKSLVLGLGNPDFAVVRQKLFGWFSTKTKIKFITCFLPVSKFAAQKHKDIFAMAWAYATVSRFLGID